MVLPICTTIITLMCVWDVFHHNYRQLVLQVDTTYVAMYDDDQVPGPNHIETLIAAAQQTSGIVSMTGRHLERVTDWEKPSVHLGGPSSWVEHCALDNVALRVDKLDRHW